MARAVTPARKITVTIAAWLVGLVIAFPIIWMVLTSFKTELEASSLPPKFLFFDWTMENYAIVQQRSDYFHHAVNSLIIAFVASWTVTLHSVTNDWLHGTKGASITGVSWNGLQATVGVESPGGELPPLETYKDDLAGKLPSYVSVSLDVKSGAQVDVR